MLLDISLPDVNGVDVLKLIHQLDARVPVIMITGAQNTRAAGEAMEHGAFAYIPKPLSVPYLDSLVAAAPDPVAHGRRLPRQDRGNPP